MVGIDFDKSLLLILNNDEKNREVILNFINSIPLFLRNKLSCIFENDNDIHVVDCYGEKRVNGMVYFFRIDKANNFLSIGKFSSKNMNDNDIFLLNLYPCPRKVDSTCRLGTLIYQKRNDNHIHVWDGDKVQYDLVKKKKGIFLKKFSQYDNLMKKRFSIVDIDKRPSIEEGLISSGKYKTRRMIGKLKNR